MTKNDRDKLITVPVLEGALPVMEISRFGNQHIYVGYKTEKFTILVLHLTVLVRVTVLVR